MIGRGVRGIALLGFALFFFLPLWAMVDYSTTDFTHGGRTLEHWKAIFSLPDLRDPAIASIELAICTVLLMLVLLLPTMIWTRLRVPSMTRPLEFLCLLPLTVPPLVIVVGINNVYKQVFTLFGPSPLVLTFVYVLLVLPYSYRALDSSLSAIDVTTLAEAGRSLGASWFSVIARVIGPNVLPGVLSAAFLSVALVLGEFTFSNIMNFNTLPPALLLMTQTDGGAAMAAAVASMIVISAMLVALSFVDRRRSERN